MAVRSLYQEPERASRPVEWPALECHDVFKIYRSGPVETVALRGLDLKIDRAAFVAVLGPSGCGKSTFLTLAAGLDDPSAGEVRAFGRSLGRLDEAELATYRAGEVAVVFQSDNLWPDLSANENLIASLRLAGHESPAEAAREALSVFGLENRLGNRAAALSGGEQQRVAIAGAAARRAPLVLADEPTGELDEGNEAIVIDSLAKLRETYGSAVVVVTHSERVARAADHVIEMRDGKVIA